MLTGYNRRREHEVNLTRHLMAAIINFSGMGASESVTAQQVWQLNMDAETEIRPITTLKQALQLLAEFN